MKFKSGDVVIYSYDNFKYKLQLVKRKAKRCDPHWDALFILNIGGVPAYYHRNDIGTYPEKYMRRLTKLEKILE